MRRIVTALTSAALALGAVALAQPAKAEVVDPPAFGLHILAPPSSGNPAGTPAYGTIRIWDMGLTWNKVNPKKGKYWWTGLDQAINNTRSINVRPLYVLGSTATWAATNTKQGTYPNKGAASVPKSSDWKDWVTAVVKRYKNQGMAYQIWNEANLANFWAGSPAQMADLTSQAASIIRKYDKTAVIVSASSTVRLTASYDKFFPAYLKAMKKKGTPVDAVAVHLYPPGDGTPATRAGYIATVKADMAAAGVAKPLWDTEVNYGFSGPGSVPGQNIDGDTAAAYVSQTYLDDVRLGVARAYWYSFTLTPYTRGGVQLMAGTAGTNAYNTTYNWIVGGDVNCVTAAVNTCTVTKNGATATIAWASTGSGDFAVPATATTQVTASGVSTPVAGGTTVTIGSMPTWFG